MLSGLFSASLIYLDFESLPKPQQEWQKVVVHLAVAEYPLGIYF